MKQLKIAFLWHQHQPYYKINGEYKLPWVRLHAIKDYFDMCLILYDYPKVKQTFNLVPSLLLQLEDYKNDEAIETVLELTKKRASELTSADKNEIIKSFFICNYQNMIEPHERYLELYNKSLEGETAIFKEQDWLDLQVWYTLTWFGPITKERSEIKYLIAKQRNFTEDDKLLLLRVQKEVISEIVPTLRRLMIMEQIEVSFSPMYHPILPLLCNSDSALESLPEMKVPYPAFKFPNDAKQQIDDAVQYYFSEFGRKPNGMWPSEGSVSDAVIYMIAGSGIKWVATDEQIMMNSATGAINRLERFFPRNVKIKDKEIHIIFREHFLTDLIGFQYSSWDAEAAAEDLINRLKYVRWELTSTYGEDCLDSAVVPIIMDGENCWEFYKENGKPFLDALYKRLNNDEQLITIKMSESLEYKQEYVKPFSTIKAGSWINGHFEVWMGQEENVKAWSALRDVRNLYEMKKNELPENLKTEIEETIAIAEGSDWFWWYSDSHQAPNKHDFDVMFREHLMNIYRHLNIEIPEELYKPFGKQEQIQILQQAEKHIHPDFVVNSDNSWEGCGCYLASMAMDAMHSGAGKINKICFGNDKEFFYLKIETEKEMSNEDKLIIEIINDEIPPVIITNNTDNENIRRLETSYYLRIPIQKQNPYIEFQFRYIASTGMTNYPRQGTLKFNILR